MDWVLIDVNGANEAKLTWHKVQFDDEREVNEGLDEHVKSVIRRVIIHVFPRVTIKSLSTTKLLPRAKETWDRKIGWLDDWKVKLTTTRRMKSGNRSLAWGKKLRLKWKATVEACQVKSSPIEVRTGSEEIQSELGEGDNGEEVGIEFEEMQGVLGEDTKGNGIKRRRSKGGRGGDENIKRVRES